MGAVRQQPTGTESALKAVSSGAPLRSAAFSQHPLLVGEPVSINTSSKLRKRDSALTKSHKTKGDLCAITAQRIALASKNWS
jgi:hypothetical protein